MKHYIIQYNYRNNYVVAVGETRVDVYNFQNNKLCYDIIDVNPIKVFIGKSCLNYMTEFSGARDDKYWDGNTILLQLKENKYMFIGEEIYTFTTQNDKIIKYISNMGNNNCSYPIAYGEKNIYLLAKKEYLSYDKITDEKIQKRVIEMDESFDPYDELEDALFKWNDEIESNIYNGSENKFENEKMNVEVIHKPFEDFKLWCNPGKDEFGNDLIGVLEKLFKKGKHFK